MSSELRQRVESFRNKLRLEIQETIRFEKGNKQNKSKGKLIEQAYHPHYFDYRECDRISVQGKFEQMFQISKKLGEGCQSVVKKVINKSTNLPYAVKTFKRADAQVISKIKPLFIFLRTLNCPTIIKPHYLFVAEKSQILRVILDYIQFPNLEQILETHKPFNLQQAREVLKILLETILYLHSRNACHRDVKPANILYDINGRDKVAGFRLIDYQICKFSRTQIIQMWTQTGSLFYKAPEMFTGSYNQQVDVWSVGVIAFQLLHGKVPFCAQFTNQTIKSIIQDSVQNKLDPNLDPLAKKFIRKCLTKNPAERITATQALRSPFILSMKSNVTTKQILKRSNSMDSKQKKKKNQRKRSLDIKNYQEEQKQYCIIKQQ